VLTPIHAVLWSRAASSVSSWATVSTELGEFSLGLIVTLLVISITAMSSGSPSGADTRSYQ